MIIANTSVPEMLEPPSASSSVTSLRPGSGP